MELSARVESSPSISRVIRRKRSGSLGGEGRKGEKQAGKKAIGDQPGFGGLGECKRGAVVVIQEEKNFRKRTCRLLDRRPQQF